MDAHVCRRASSARRRMRLYQRWRGAFNSDEIEMWERRTPKHDRDRMPARIAGPDDRASIDGMRIGHVLVRGGPVMMLRMIVIRVGVDVQRGRVALRDDQGESEQDRDEAMHKPESM